MNIAQFCKYAGISHQAVYRKIKTNPEKFKGHITYKGKKGKTIKNIDAFAIELLKPASTRYKHIEERNRKLSVENTEIKEKNQNIENENKMLKDNFDFLQKSHTDSVNFGKAAASERNSALSRLDELQKKYNAVCNEKSAAEANAELLKNEAEAYKEKVAELTSQLAEEKTKSEVLSEENERLKACIAEYIDKKPSNNAIKGIIKGFMGES